MSPEKKLHDLKNDMFFFVSCHVVGYITGKSVWGICLVNVSARMVGKLFIPNGNFKDVIFEESLGSEQRSRARKP